MLKTTADENPRTWPQRLATVMAAYRMTVHKTTGVTPNMAMLGREVMMPAALIARPPEEPHSTRVPFVSNLRDALLDAHRRVRTLRNRLLEGRNHITTNVLVSRRLTLVNTCGCFGRGLRFGSAFESCNGSGPGLGESKPASRNWWW